MAPQKFLHWDLSFLSKDLEDGFLIYKTNIQRTALNVLIIAGLVILVGTWIINPYNLPNYEGIYLLFQIGLIVVAFTSFCLLRKKPQWAEHLIVFVISSIEIGFLEGTKNNREYWGTTVFYLAGALIELNLMTLIITKVSWKKITVISLVVSSLACFQSLPFSDNYNSKFYPLILFIEKNIIHIGFGFWFERHDRRAFFEMKNYEFSLNLFKEMIIEVIPNSIIITDGDTILFQNQESINIFNCPENKDLLEKLKTITIMNKLEPMSQKEDSTKPPETMALFDFRTLEIQQSVYEYIQFNKPELEMEKKIHKSFNVTYKYPDKQTPMRFDVQIKNIYWERKHAIMLLLTENPMIDKVKHLNEMSHYKDRLLATVSHDLRTPLNGIMGMIGVTLEMELEFLVRKNLTVAQRSSYLLLSMINDILDFSQISNGKLRLNYANFSIREVVKDISKLIKFQAKRKGLSFIRECKVRRDLYIRSDPNRLRQVLLNLLGNSLKFTETGFIKITVDDLPADSGEMSGVIIKVEDSGKGIKKEDQSKLFRLFGKVDSSASSSLNPHGVGLGLAISQSLVKILNKEKEGFEIKLESELGQGSCFWFELLSISNESEQDMLNEENFITQEIDGEVIEDIPVFRKKDITSSPCNRMSQSFWSPVLRILLVDDDQINLLVGTCFLKSDPNIEFETAHNGFDAVEKIEKSAFGNRFFDLILMDCNMPKMDGFEASLKIREMIRNGQIPDLKIVACTANAAESDYRKTQESGMDDYITKPYTKVELFKKIENNIQKKKDRKGLYVKK